MAFKSQLDLGLPEVPQVSDDVLRRELLAVYQAIRTLQEAVDKIARHFNLDLSQLP